MPVFRAGIVTAAVTWRHGDTIMHWHSGSKNRLLSTIFSSIPHPSKFKTI
jgi:hypothetical protein